MLFNRPPGKNVLVLGLGEPATAHHAGVKSRYTGSEMIDGSLSPGVRSSCRLHRKDSSGKLYARRALRCDRNETDRIRRWIVEFLVGGQSRRRIGSIGQQGLTMRSLLAADWRASSNETAS